MITSWPVHTRKPVHCNLPMSVWRRLAYPYPKWKHSTVQKIWLCQSILQAVIVCC